MLETHELTRHEAVRAGLEARWLESLTDDGEATARSTSAAISAATSRPIYELNDDLVRLLDRGRSLRGNVQELRTRIDRVIQALDQPKRIADSLSGLSSDLGALSGLLQIARVVRVVRPLTDRLRSSALQLKGRVDAAERRARDLDRRVASTRDRLRKLSQEMKAFLDRLDDVLGHVEESRQAILSVRGCMENLPEGPVRERGFVLLDDFAAIVQPSVAAVSDGLGAADSQVAAINGSLRSIEDQIGQAAQRILDGVRSVRGAFGPVLGPLRELVRVLDRKIDIRIWCFSIRQILEGISLPWPFSFVEELFWKAANAILDPILRSLRLDISLPNLPGLDLLDGIRLEVPGQEELARLVADIRQQAENLRNLADRFNVECPPREDASRFSESLLVELATAEPRWIDADEAPDGAVQ